MKRPTNEIIIEVLARNGGLLLPSSKAFDVSRSTLDRWIKDDPDLKAAVFDIREGMLDFCEGKLFRLINEDNIVAILFFLKTIGKKRGYLEGASLMIDTTIKVEYDDQIKEAAPKTIGDFATGEEV